MNPIKSCGFGSRKILFVSIFLLAFEDVVVFEHVLNTVVLLLIGLLTKPHHSVIPHTI